MLDTDFRTHRTRLMIRSAYLDLLEKQPRDSIRVQDICNAVHCSRKTFYRYYETKELLHKETVKELIEYIGADYLTSLRTDTSLEQIRKVVYACFERIRKREREYRIIFQSDGIEFARQIRDNYHDAIYSHRSEAGSYHQFVYESIASISVLCQKYLIDHPECSIDELTDAFCSIFSNDLFSKFLSS